MCVCLPLIIFLDHNGFSFSTYDADHDVWSGNCAVTFRGACSRGNSRRVPHSDSVDGGVGMRRCVVVRRLPQRQSERCALRDSLLFYDVSPCSRPVPPGIYFPSPGTHASYADGADWCVSPAYEPSRSVHTGHAYGTAGTTGSVTINRT